MACLFAGQYFLHFSNNLIRSIDLQAYMILTIPVISDIFLHLLQDHLLCLINSLLLIVQPAARGCPPPPKYAATSLTGQYSLERKTDPGCFLFHLNKGYPNFYPVNIPGIVYQARSIIYFCPCSPLASFVLPADGQSFHLPIFPGKKGPGPVVSGHYNGNLKTWPCLFRKHLYLLPLIQP